MHQLKYRRNALTKIQIEDILKVNISTVKLTFVQTGAFNRVSYCV